LYDCTFYFVFIFLQIDADFRTRFKGKQDLLYVNFPNISKNILQEAEAGMW